MSRAQACILASSSWATIDMPDELTLAIDEFNEGTITFGALKDAGIDPALLMCFPADWE